jgi:hypothetical protein
MEPRNGTHEDQPRHRPLRRARRPGPRPRTRCRTRRRQPGSGRSRRAGGQPRQRRRRHRGRRRDRQARRPRRPARDGAGRHRHPVKGTKPGIPDTWTLAEPAPDGTSPAADPQAEQAGQPGEDPGSPDGAAEDETAGSIGQDRTAETGDPAPEDGDDAEAGTSDAPDPEAAESGPRDDACAEDDHEDAVPGGQNDEAAPGSDPDDGDAPDDDDASADAGGEAGDAPDPAPLTDLTEHLDQVRAAADATELVLTASGDLKIVLAALDEIAEQAAQARRTLKAAIGGRKAPAVRPGGPRDKVLAHLDAHPGGEFTPHEIHKVLSHSSGAIANALDTLVKLGEAEVATDKPRRFRPAAQPAGAAPEADNADSAEQDGTGVPVTMDPSAPLKRPVS